MRQEREVESEAMKTFVPNSAAAAAVALLLLLLPTQADSRTEAYAELVGVEAADKC